jgi:hypothetical protein
VTTCKLFNSTPIEAFGTFNELRILLNGNGSVMPDDTMLYQKGWDDAKENLDEE